MGRDLDIDDAVAHHPEAKQELADLRNEVERLKEQLKIEQGWVKQYREAYGQSAEKIERLTGLLEEALHEMKQYSVNMKAVRRIEAKWKGQK